MINERNRGREDEAEWKTGERNGEKCRKKVPGTVVGNLACISL